MVHFLLLGCPPSTLATQLVSTEHVRGTPYQDEISCVRRPQHTWLTTFLTQQSMMVVLKGKSSDEVPVKSGVPQGTVLSPILFLCHTNDLPSCVTSQVWLFADSCLVYREINKFHDHITLQNDLKQLEFSLGPKMGNGIQCNEIPHLEH